MLDLQITFNDGRTNRTFTYYTSTDNGFTWSAGTTVASGPTACGTVTITLNSGVINKQLRERNAWAQDELAHRSGTTAANISRIENGKHSPGTELLGSIAYVLGVKVYELIALAEGFQPPQLQPSFDADEELVIRHFRRMAPEERELFKSMAVALTKVKQPATTRRSKAPQAGL